MGWEKFGTCRSLSGCPKIVGPDSLGYFGRNIVAEKLKELIRIKLKNNR